MSADTCSESEFAGNHVYQLPINGKDVNEVKSNLNDYLEAHTNITHLVLVLNDNLKNAELELPNLDELLFLSFVYHNIGKDPLHTWFELNVYKMHNNIKITVNKNTCNNVEYYTIPYGIDEVYFHDNHCTSRQFRVSFSWWKS